MPEFVSAYQGDDSNVVVTVSRDFAEGAGLTTLKSDPPLDGGRPRGPREGNRKSAPAATTTGGSAASKSEETSK